MNAPFRRAPFDPHRNLLCLICRQGLTHFSTSRGEGYTHQRQDLTDHEPVPVSLGIVPMLPVCDFCNEALPEGHWYFTATSFDYADGGGSSIGDWCACSECKQLVVKRQWPKLAQRVAYAPSHISDPQWNAPLMVSKMLRRYQQLEHHLVGSPRWETDVLPYPADRDLTTPTIRAEQAFWSQQRAHNNLPATPRPYGNSNDS